MPVDFTDILNPKPLIAPPNLSPEEDDIEWYLKTLDESIERRFNHVLAVERGGQAAIDLELEICAANGIYWLQWYGWTYDPRNTTPLPANLPFDLAQRQIDLWNFTDYLMSVKQDGCCKKSRGVGFTWLMGAYAWHKWRWSDGFKTTFGSRKATEVDTIGSPDCIFEKIRLLYRALPKWMLPRGFNPFEHDKQMLLINPENKNTIRGEGGDEMGRGGRSTLYVIDEAGYLERADRVEAATSANCDVRMWGSTLNVKNDNNFFQRKYNSTPAERVFRFHYSELPINTPARMARKKADTSPDVWAADYEIDDSYTAEDITIPQLWVKSSQKLKALCEAKGIKLEPAIYGKAGGDVGGGKAQSVIVATFGPIVTVPKAWGNPDTTETALKMLDFCAETTLPAREDSYIPKIRFLRYDNVGIGQGVASTMKHNPRQNLTVTGVNVGDPASDTKWPDGEYAHEKFFNSKAEGWWTARECLKKTHEMVLWLENPNNPEGRQHPVDELMALPSDMKNIHVDKLCTQLSQPKWHRRENGKIQIEDKKSLAHRGIPSPDYAEALILTKVAPSKAEKWVKFAAVNV